MTIPCRKRSTFTKEELAEAAEKAAFFAPEVPKKSGAVMRVRPPWPTWLELGVPYGATINGYNVKSKRIHYTPAEMRSMHQLIIGATGSGKSYYMTSAIFQDILQADGVARSAFVVDPHGSLVSMIEEMGAADNIHLIRKIQILRPGRGQIFGFNFLQEVPGVDPDVVMDDRVAAVATVMLENLERMPLLRQTLSALFHAIITCKLTLNEAIDLLRLKDATGLRRYVTEQITHPVYRAYFEDLKVLSVSKRKEEWESTGRRVTEFLKLEVLRLCFGVLDPEKCLDFNRILAEPEGVVVLVDLSGPHLSRNAARLLGTLMVNSAITAAKARGVGAGPPLTIYLDEVARYLTDDVAEGLDELRKYNVSFVLALQTLGQLDEMSPTLRGRVMSNCRTKIMFGGINDEDAKELAANCWRGSFDLQRSKDRFEKYVPTGDELVWLQNESESAGHSSSRGQNWSTGTSHAEERSTTDSRSRTLSEADTESSSITNSHSHTTQESITNSESDTVSQSTTHSHSTTDSESVTDGENYTESSGSTDTSSQSSSQGVNESENLDFDYQLMPLPQLPKSWHSGEGQSESSAEGSSHSDSSTTSRGLSTARTRGRSVTDGVAETSGTAHTTGVAHTTGTSDTIGHATTTGSAKTHGTAETTGFAIGQGTSDTRSASAGGSLTEGSSRSASTGRGQTFRTVYEKAPIQAYTLDELLHMASTTLANLRTGVCIIKIGQRPPVRVKAIPLDRKHVAQEHLTRVRQEMALSAPFILSRGQAQRMYNDFREKLEEKLEKRPGDDEDENDSDE